VFETIAAELAKEEKIQLIGFGTFEVRERAERTGRNPQTGEEMAIPASKVPAFKPGKELKEAIKSL
ncbi:HU family DNA-binding protein, partial [Priestia megaterium]|uniref:HU family DNA-binding protein n=1 Tax=Priestia megaterium TaxID=1404 RepID=UPI002E238616|nr:HU family DNA-binding protein [Priestia megaterium]